MNIRFQRIAYTMFKGIFEQRNKKHRWYCNIGNLLGNNCGNYNLIRMPELHQRYKTAYKFDFFLQFNRVLGCIIQQIPHQRRKPYNRILCLFGIHFDERMDVVERIHKKMRAYLMPKQCQVGFEMRFLDIFSQFFLAQPFRHQFKCSTSAYNEDTNDKIISKSHQRWFLHG